MAQGTDRTGPVRDRRPRGLGAVPRVRRGLPGVGLGDSGDGYPGPGTGRRWRWRGHRRCRGDRRCRGAWAVPGPRIGAGAPPNVAVPVACASQRTRYDVRRARRRGRTRLPGQRGGAGCPSNPPGDPPNVAVRVACRVSSGTRCDARPGRGECRRDCRPSPGPRRRGDGECGAGDPPNVAVPVACHVASHHKYDVRLALRGVSSRLTANPDRLSDAQRSGRDAPNEVVPLLATSEAATRRRRAGQQAERRHGHVASHVESHSKYDVRRRSDGKRRHSASTAPARPATRRAATRVGTASPVTAASS